MSRPLAVVATAAVLVAAAVRAESPADYVPKLAEFPPAGVGVELAGELVTVDHVNRRGGLRLDGDFQEDRYHSAPTFAFALLPYGEVYFHGAPADLHDVPLGTRLVGRFVLPPEGDTTVPAVASKYLPPQNHALLLEDDFSRALRAGRGWKVTAFDREQGRLTLEAVSLAGEPVAGSEPVTHSVDGSTRIWKGTGFGTLDDLAAAAAADGVIQLNLTWHPAWANKQFHCSDLWLDPPAWEAASERQRQRHLRRMNLYWVPARIDSVQHDAAGKGGLTVTLLGGFDPEVYKRFTVKPDVSNSEFPVYVACAAATLRSWWQNHDKASATVTARREVPDPPLGSSGIELDIRLNSPLQEGFQPGRFVRLAVVWNHHGGRASPEPHTVKPPPEWRLSFP